MTSVYSNPVSTSSSMMSMILSVTSLPAAMPGLSSPRSTSSYGWIKFNTLELNFFAMLGVEN